MKKKNGETDWKKILKITIPLIIAVISIFGLSKIATSADFHAKTIASLDEKKTTVLELTAASTATSTAITLIPGDTATPIAEKLADLSSYFLIVLCAIYLEKYLLTLTGAATFYILIPAACILYAANVFWKNDGCRRIVRKLAIFGVAIICVIPASVKVSNLIETTYNSSIEETIETAKQATEEIQKNADENTQEEGFFNGIISKAQNSVSGAAKKAEGVVNRFMEALAVMIVTSCVIPIVVLFFFVWLVKIILGVDIQLPNRRII